MVLGDRSPTLLSISFYYLSLNEEFILVLIKIIPNIPSLTIDLCSVWLKIDQRLLTSQKNLKSINKRTEMTVNAAVVRKAHFNLCNWFRWAKKPVDNFDFARPFYSRYNLHKPLNKNKKVNILQRTAFGNLKIILPNS